MAELREKDEEISKLRTTINKLERTIPGADPGFGKGGFYRYKNARENLATPTLGSTTPTFD